MAIKPIHKALKALQTVGAHTDDSFYPSFVTDKKIFLALLENVDIDIKDANLMSRFEVSPFLPAEKIVFHEKECLQ